MRCILIFNQAMAVKSLDWSHKPHHGLAESDLNVGVQKSLRFTDFLLVFSFLFFYIEPMTNRQHHFFCPLILKPSDAGSVLKVVSITQENWSTEEVVLEEFQVFQVCVGATAP